MTFVIVLTIAIVLVLAGGIILLIVLGGQRESDVDQDEQSLRIPVIDKRETSESEINEKSDYCITEDSTSREGMIRVMSGSMNGMTVPIKDGETLYLGKDPSVSNIVFTSDYRNVSRQHCSVTYNAQTNMYYVVDMSSNGTFFTGNKRLPKGTRTSIVANTAILLANNNCVVLLG